MRKKVFRNRESAFTRILEKSKEAQAVYAMIASETFLIMIYTIIKYIINPRTYVEDVDFLYSQFTGMNSFFDSWIKMHAVVIIVIYPLTRVWMHHECKYVTLYALSLVPPFTFILIHPVYTLIEGRFLYILTFSLTVEQVRIIMKLISFIVENARKVDKSLTRTVDSSTDSNGNFESMDNYGFPATSNRFHNQTKYHIPTLGQLIYFLFAPTLIYRDSYPRSPGNKVNWYKVTSLFGEFGALIFLALQVVNRVTTPRLVNIGIEPLRVSDMIDDYIKLTMIAVLCTFGLGYGFLHCWLNAWAEMLHFGDREFYQEWWTSNNFSQFWRRWNGVVQPWIYEYIYKPMIYHTGGNRFIATFTVFLVSAIVHEHVTGFALGGFLPMFAIAMLVFFPFVVAFHILRNLNAHYSGVFIFAFNWIVWSTTMYGYGLEVYSRANCPISPDQPGTIYYYIQFIKPRLLSCVKIEWI